ncbi:MULTISPECIES: DmsC/YnfH family molybdoenzyme membrane anchor subunit [unclassified Serratia (in: enterobacteria)]|uniref:DmsC/YnfH family molybdoenzyme membrane anchor subunit n=1 Tax=unclassified Serratia (in: enterobacteria) TaxID=2647522 RepID=UPI0027F25557|nr:MULTISPECIES: DmsC/YnfH family molybdoenzyme membrane anchor subunit [unclassified Serratia (in: enterobacteria)]MDQ7098767.1 DmsC/YnfH family molybdoenzyme membrane anchor subunit [Serratia sp. MF2]MDQ7102388.1 DmsC/YnfH family molybdoenzyme membrane anchor subunit [Serratia sp. MF1(2023)]
MGSGWHEWPLALFTVLGQCVVGGVIITGLAWLSAQDDRAKQQRIVRAMFFLWALMGMGFLASTMHMGSPLRAMNALNRLGHSALSNEIAGGILFFAVGGGWWLLAVLRIMPAALGKPWLFATMALGVMFVWLMSRVYLIDTVPTWNNGYTALGFFMTVLLAGPLLAVTLLSGARFTFNGGKFAVLSGAAMLLSLGAALMQGMALMGIHSSVQQATMLVPDYGSLQVWRLVLLGLGLGCWICPLVRSKPPKTAVLAVGFMLVLAAELIGRGVFYGLHMTVGVAVAG